MEEFLKTNGLHTWLQRFAEEGATLFVESAPYLLVGFALAGLLKVFVPPQLVTRHLGKSDLRSVLLAALYGTPIPLCSCSVLPTATALRRAGASKGATTSFLISTPETGVDSVSITWALFDPILTIARPVVAFLTATITGAVVNVVSRNDEASAADVASDAAAPESCAAGHGPADRQADGPADGHGHAHDHEDEEELWTRSVKAAGPLERVRLALRYAFGPLIDDITPWLFVGFLISGVIAASVPATFFEQTLPRGWPALLLMAVAGTPMYVCATASTPIAATLVAKGLEPGAALVFLLVGPATNAATLAVVGGLLGRRVLWVYVSGIVLVALAAGAWINALYASLAIDLSSVVAERALEGVAAVGPWALGASVAFAALLAVSAWRTRTLSWLAGAIVAPLKPLGLDPRSGVARSLPLVALALLWASTSATALQPGETGFRLRFGRLVETLEQPGLHLGLPWPLERVERLRTDEVASLLAGIATNPDEQLAGVDPALKRERFVALRDALEAEAEMLTRDEVLLSISYGVHYRLRDARKTRFGVEDPLALVRAMAASAVRKSVAARTSSELLVGVRQEVELEAGAALQRDLDLLGSGLDVVGVWLRNVHAPPLVHPAYRDVASALEDREREVHEAEADRAEVLHTAVAAAGRLEQVAIAEALDLGAEAAGRTVAFDALAGVFAESPRLMALRLWLEAVENGLGPPRLAIVLGTEVSVELYSGNAQRPGGPRLPGLDGAGFTGTGFTGSADGERDK